MPIDISVSGSFGLYILAALTERGLNWLKTKVHSTDWQWIGNSIVIEGSVYLNEIIENAKNEGIEVF